MENFKKAFIKTATRYAEFVEAKIISVSKVEMTLPKENNLKTEIGMIHVGNKQPTISQELCEEVQTLIVLAAEVEKMEVDDQINEKSNITSYELEKSVIRQLWETILQ